MTASEKVAYLKGLIEGQQVDLTTKEGKLLSTIVDILEDLAYGLEDAEENALDIGEELDALSDDLADVEDYLFGDEEEDGCDCGCEDEDCDCDDDDFEYTVVCPSCNSEIVLEAADLEDTVITCPNCGETLELEFDEDDEDDSEDDE